MSCSVPGCSCHKDWDTPYKWKNPSGMGASLSSSSIKEGRKDDTGKLRWDLLPVGPLTKVVEVYTMGAQKYDDRNWEKGIKWGRVFAAMMRHSWKWWSGEKNDQEDGQHHLASVVWCALVLMQYERTHPELDDRLVDTTALLGCVKP